jgi:hypothetical protein
MERQQARLKTKLTNGDSKTLKPTTPSSLQPKPQDRKTHKTPTTQTQTNNQITYLKTHHSNNYRNRILKPLI